MSSSLITGLQYEIHVLHTPDMRRNFEYNSVFSYFTLYTGQLVFRMKTKIKIFLRKKNVYIYSRRGIRFRFNGYTSPEYRIPTK